MGYKIEIILISIAVVLCGSILVCIAFDNRPAQKVQIVVDNNTVTTSKTKTVKVDKTNKDKPTSNLLNINTATKEELMELDGIGEVLAQRIIDYRKQNKFVSISQILDVDGIGEVKFEAMKDKITVE